MVLGRSEPQHPQVDLYVEDMAAVPERTVPAHLREGLALYIVYGYPPGHFMRAVLMNDLREAVARGDDEALAGLVAIVRYLYNRVPREAWGSPEKVLEWRGMVPA